MYDIYNNAMTLGGKLNVNFDRYLRAGEGQSIFLGNSVRNTKPKYELRNTMEDITLRVALVVILLRFFFRKVIICINSWSKYCPCFSYQTINDSNQTKQQSNIFFPIETPASTHFPDFLQLLCRIWATFWNISISTDFEHFDKKKLLSFFHLW